MILVTGGSGRVGSYLVEALVKQGEEVRILAKERPKNSEGVEVILGDILDKETVRKATEGVNTIYHLAAILDYLAPKKLMHDVNVTGTKNVVESSNAVKLIFLSSTAVYGKKMKQNPANEDTPFSPSNYYGQTKVEAEKLVLKNNGIVVRSPDVFGPGFTEGYNFVISQLEKQKLPLIGDGKNRIHWIHINDLIQALLLAKEKGKPGEVYLVAGKEVKTMNELLSLLSKNLNVPPPSKKISKNVANILAYVAMLSAKVKGKKPKLIPEYVQKMASDRYFDTTKAQNELGFSPKIDYEYAAKEMIQQYQNSKAN